VAGVSALVLFGSRASGRPRTDSDLDVAVLPAPGADRRRLQSRLAVALAHLAPQGRVDVVLLDEAPELLRHTVLSGGELLLCRDEAAWRELRVRTMREHGDREHYRRILRQGLKRRLTEGRDDGRSGRARQSLERTGRLSS
jgi:predicted nucleotidyltransferase